jgi:hypothetical protein
MRGWKRALALVVAGSSTAAAVAAAPPTPLFASDAPIRLTITGPISTLVSKRSRGALPAILVAPDGTYPITLAPRGITRLKSDVCQFPPLRVEFAQRPAAASLFQGQHRLKLVTHCKQSADFQQKVLLEYAAYRLYNLLTPASFRARLATIDYVDADGRPYVTRVGFFLEDIEDVARRNGMVEARMGPRVPLTQIDPLGGARFAVFNYMISNYDWSMRAGPEGDNCCHNGRLIAANGSAAVLTPVPYDFDFSGLVDAPYAGVPEGVPIEHLGERSYRGYCAHMTQARGVAAEMSRRRADFTAVLGTIPGMTERTRKRAASFLDGFYRDVDSGRIFKTCVN